MTRSGSIPAKQAGEEPVEGGSRELISPLSQGTVNFSHLSGLLTMVYCSYLCMCVQPMAHGLSVAEDGHECNPTYKHKFTFICFETGFLCVSLAVLASNSAIHQSLLLEFWD